MRPATLASAGHCAPPTPLSRAATGCARSDASAIRDDGGKQDAVLSPCHDKEEGAQRPLGRAPLTAMPPAHAARAHRCGAPSPSRAASGEGEHDGRAGDQGSERAAAAAHDRPAGAHDRPAGTHEDSRPLGLLYELAAAREAAAAEAARRGENGDVFRESVEAEELRRAVALSLPAEPETASQALIHPLEIEAAIEQSIASEPEAAAAFAAEGGPGDAGCQPAASGASGATAAPLALVQTRVRVEQPAAAIASGSGGAAASALGGASAQPAPEGNNFVPCGAARRRLRSAERLQKREAEEMAEALRRSRATGTSAPPDGDIVRAARGEKPEGFELRWAGRASSTQGRTDGDLGNPVTITAPRGSPARQQAARQVAVRAYKAVIAAGASGGGAAQVATAGSPDVRVCAELDTPAAAARREAALQRLMYEAESGKRVALTDACTAYKECHVEVAVAEARRRWAAAREQRETLCAKVVAPMKPYPAADASATKAAAKAARQRDLAAAGVVTPPRRATATAYHCACGVLALTLASCCCGGFYCPACGADSCQCAGAQLAAGGARAAAPENARAIGFVGKPLEDPSAPVGLIVGEYSGRLQEAFAARGVVMLTACYKNSERPGALHYRGDARDVLYSRRWRLIVAHPTCRDVAKSGCDVWPEKIASGSHWWGLADILFWLCAPADAVVVEQPIGAFERYYMPPCQSVHPYWFGDGEQKHWRLFTSDNVPRLLPTSVSGGRSTAAHDTYWSSQEEAEAERSRTPKGLAAAFAEQLDPRWLRERRAPPPIYSIEVHQLAANYRAAGHPLPPEHDHPLARPASRVDEGCRTPMVTPRKAWPDGVRAASNAAEARERFLQRKLASGAVLTPAQREAASAARLDGDSATGALRLRYAGSKRRRLPPDARVRWLEDEGMLAVPGLRAGDMVFVGVDLCGGGAPRVLVPARKACAFGARGDGGSRDDAVRHGQQMAARLGLARHTTLLAGEMGAEGPEDDARVRLVVALAPPAAGDT